MSTVHDKIMKIDQKAHFLKVPELLYIFQFFDQCLKDSLAKMFFCNFAFLLEERFSIRQRSMKFEDRALKVKTFY
jgi:hypothetical protein